MATHLWWCVLCFLASVPVHMQARYGSKPEFFPYDLDVSCCLHVWGVCLVIFVSDFSIDCCYKIGINRFGKFTGE